MAVKTQCFLTDGTAHTQDLQRLHQLSAATQCPKKPKLPEKSMQVQQVALCQVIFELITGQPLFLSQILHGTNPEVQIATHTLQKDKRI